MSLHTEIMQHNPYLSYVNLGGKFGKQAFQLSLDAQKKLQSWDRVCGEVTISFFIIQNKYWRMHVILLYRGSLNSHGPILLLLTN